MGIVRDYASKRCKQRLEGQLDTKTKRFLDIVAFFEDWEPKIKGKRDIAKLRNIESQARS